MMMPTLPPPCILPVIARTTTTTTFAPKFAFINVKAHKISKHRKIYNKSTLNDYFHQSVNLLTKSDGGPPRWFSPLECASRFNNSPLLLSLPGIDGNGLALMMHYQRLGEIYEIWCLHIPTTDQTPFTDLVKMVEGTVRSESKRFPNRPIYLVGESMGACLGLAVAAHAPDVDLVLLLANPVTRLNKSQFLPLVRILKLVLYQLHIKISYLLSLITGAPSKIMSFTDEKGLPLLPSVTKISKDVSTSLSYVYGLADVLTVETFLWRLKMVESAFDYSNSHIHNVKAQTLVLCSEKDPLLQEGRRLRRILPNCDLRTFKDGGHGLFLEEGFDLVTVIKGVGFYRRSKHINYVSDFLPPDMLGIRKTHDSLRWWDVATSPVMLSTLETGKIVRGLDGIPSDGPVVYVGYHNMAALEMMQLIRRFMTERNIIMRGLGHPFLFERLKKEGNFIDLARFDILKILGAVPVTASNMYKLFSHKSHFLLYPGGVRECFHRKGEEYKLFWPEQPEFVRAAAVCGAKIIPFGAVGEDDFVQLVLDYNDQMKIPWLKDFIEELQSEIVSLRTDVEGEIAKQDIHYPGLLPKLPGRYYYLFGKPIETQGRKQEMRKRENAQELYSEVKSEVEKCLAYCIRRREEDPYRSIIARFVYQATHGGFDSEVPTFHID